MSSPQTPRDARVPDAAGFVRRSTRPVRLSLVPEVSIRVADDALLLWQRTEDAFVADDNAAASPAAGATGSGRPPPYWAFPWAGGQALARYLLDAAIPLRGRRVLDVGAGSGLTAIAAALRGATVTATEIDPLAAVAIAVNAADNGVDVRVVGADVTAGTGAGDDADLVLIGDVFYERTLATSMLAFARRVTDRGADVLIGDIGRRYLPRNALEAVQAYTVTATAGLEDEETKRAVVWRLAGAATPSASLASTRRR